MDTMNSNSLFEEHYAEYSEYIKKYCYYKLSDYPEDADDCVQETFAVFANKLKSGVEFEYAKAFLIKTASNFVKQKYREIEKRKSCVQIGQDELNLCYEQIFFEIDDETIDNLKEEIIASLTESERILLSETCKKYKNSYKTTKQLAKKYNCSESAVRQRIFVLRSKIKRTVKEKTENL